MQSLQEHRQQCLQPAKPLSMMPMELPCCKPDIGQLNIWACFPGVSNTCTPRQCYSKAMRGQVIDA